MNPTHNTRKHSNPVHFPFVRWLLLTLILGVSVGLFYVHIKNQQFALGEKIRLVERHIREARAENEVLLARVSEMSSHRVLRQRLAEGLLAMKPIEDSAIARLLPPAIATDDGVIRTAFHKGSRQ